MTTPAETSEANAVRKTCPKCGYIRETSELNCDKCGRLLQSVSDIRIRGVLSVLLGVALLAFMGWLSLWVYNAITEPTPPGSTPRFTGGPEEIGFIVFGFGLVILIALAGTIGGLWQIIFGKRNKWIVYLVIVLGLVFIGTGLLLTMSN
jgi:hypothetical protein